MLESWAQALWPCQQHCTILLPVLRSISWSEELPAINNILCRKMREYGNFTWDQKFNPMHWEWGEHTDSFMNGKSQMHNIFMWFEHQAKKTKCLGPRGLSSRAEPTQPQWMLQDHYLVAENHLGAEGKTMNNIATLCVFGIF
jgi:hypothetical protein